MTATWRMNGAGRTRTGARSIKSRVLYQLSYRPNSMVSRCYGHPNDHPRTFDGGGACGQLMPLQQVSRIRSALQHRIKSPAARMLSASVRVICNDIQHRTMFVRVADLSTFCRQNDHPTGHPVTGGEIPSGACRCACLGWPRTSALQMPWRATDLPPAPSAERAGKPRCGGAEPTVAVQGRCAIS